jgi:beta-glucanase (GH16 family)
MALLAMPFVQAIKGPSVEGMKIIWQDDFSGSAGASPDAKTWNIARDTNTNNELQDYTSSNANIQISGGDTLQLVPWKDSKNGAWTSGRVETKGSWAPAPGKKLRVAAGLRMGSAANQKGMWPAFWMLGDAMRHGTQWPLCGELDIFEQVNGDGIAHGTVHCGTENGGVCNEPLGRGSSTQLGDDDFHTWSLVIDRTSGNWQTETIEWARDGVPFNKLSGAELGDEGIWSTIAHSPMYILLNVAVGGIWPVSNPARLNSEGPIDQCLLDTAGQPGCID